MIVELKIPDNVALTTQTTLDKMSYTQIENVKRYNYYSFKINGNKEDFCGMIQKIDVLVNANKHRALFKFPHTKKNIPLK